MESRKIIEMTNSNRLLDIPKCKATKGMTREALDLGKQKVFFKSIDKVPEEITHEKRDTHVETIKEETNTNNCEDDYVENMSDEIYDSSGSEYIPESNPSATESDEDFSDELSFQQSITSVETQEKVSNTNIYVTDVPPTSDLDNSSINGNIVCKADDLTLEEFVEEPVIKIEAFQDVRCWTKQNSCPYCFKDVTHFPRHLIRNHNDEGAIKELMSLPLKSTKRKNLLNNIRRQGNFVARSHRNTIRPIRRPRATLNLNNTSENDLYSDDKYVACPDCLGYFKKKYLRRHRNKCTSTSKTKLENRETLLALSQIFSVCVGSHGEFCSILRLISDVFPIMRNDSISKQAMNDLLICLYAESLLQKHKRCQIKNVISDKMRELGRLMNTLKNITGVQQLFDALKPRFFECFVSATKVISGYNVQTRNFKAPSLAIRMGTTLEQVCDTAIKMVLEQNSLFPCENPDEILKGIQQLNQLIKNHWDSEISHLALKDVNEKQYERPKLLSLTEDVIKFQTFLTKEAKEACHALMQNRQIKVNFKRLTECILAITILLNRKRIDEIQYLTVKAYSQICPESQQKEILNSLTEVAMSLTKKFKRVIIQEKGSKPVSILFPKDIQDYIEVLLRVRSLCVHASNQYLFANPNTDNGHLHGYRSLKEIAEKAGVLNKDLFTSTRLMRKQIATILQVLNITENEMEQIVTFMGHTEKKHESYYRLSQDVFQTAKVSKLLLAIDKGNTEKYKGKTLDEIDIESDLDEWDSDDEIVKTTKKCVKEKVQKKLYDDSLEKSDGDEELIDSFVEERDREEESGEERDRKCEDAKKRVEKKKIIRRRWAAEDKKLIKEYFKEHIKRKKAPVKAEIERFFQKHNNVRKHTNWVKLKAFVYNCYK